MLLQKLKQFLLLLALFLTNLVKLIVTSGVSPDRDLYVNVPNAGFFTLQFW